MGVTCRPWGPIKRDFDKLSFQMRKDAELAKKSNSKAKKRSNEPTSK